MCHLPRLSTDLSSKALAAHQAAVLTSMESGSIGAELQTSFHTITDGQELGREASCIVQQPGLARTP